MPASKVTKHRVSDLVVLVVLGGLVTLYGFDAYSASSDVLNLILVLPVIAIVLVLCVVQFFIELRNANAEAPSRESTSTIAMTAEFKRNYPQRFNTLAEAMRKALENEGLLEILERSAIGSRWTGPEQSEITMKTTFKIFEDYSYLLKL